jgi:hypothetical protein
MATTIKHCNINIITLANDETMHTECAAGDIALVQDENGWWTNFIGEQGQVDGYDAPFNSYNEALWAAKAAAEFEAAEFDAM